MDQQQHMTKTEAHPYHHGRGMKVYDPNCPLCREGHEPERGTYVSWSLYELALQRAESLAQLVLEADREKGSGFDTLASATWDEIVTAAKAIAIHKHNPPPKPESDGRSHEHLDS